MSLTGKTRHRASPNITSGYLLVLQVQELSYRYCKYVAGHKKCLMWRDATVEDLAELSNWKFNVVNGE